MPFGDSIPDQDPDGNSADYVLNLRFPGQYYDSESGLHYNYFRDYDPGIGRYIESDPIGLDGGMNTFGYSFQNPTRFSDRSGLDILRCDDFVNPDERLKCMFEDLLEPAELTARSIVENCTLRCSVDCFITSSIFTVTSKATQKALEIAAEEAAKALLKKGLIRAISIIPYVNAISALSDIYCVGSCILLE